MPIALPTNPVVAEILDAPKMRAFVPMYRRTCFFAQKQRNDFEWTGLITAAGWRRARGFGEETHGR